MSQKFFKIFSKFFTLTNNSLQFSSESTRDRIPRIQTMHHPRTARLVLVRDFPCRFFYLPVPNDSGRISTISETDSSLIPVKFGPRFLIFLVQNLDSRSGPEFLGLSSFDGFLGQRISSCIKKFFKF